MGVLVLLEVMEIPIKYVGLFLLVMLCLIIALEINKLNSDELQSLLVENNFDVMSNVIENFAFAK